ncbi:hypothetical protein NMK34_04475 [Micromonospora sp. BRA006-A]|uniref:hypothetical protein n=1 Tax=Micromonospora sp. BRA006-A TaxID=2962860 RepID=UPI00296EFB52|nr:hypothetical protein [Micromonospora sp. BRA006-A]MDW3845855.1 hypothetical protein [Micromonospora sp. BRA006-A]
MSTLIAAHLRIAPLTAAATVDPMALRHLLYAQCGPGNGVEHIRVRAGPHGADIIAFIDGNDPEKANELLRQIVEKAIAATTPLHFWRVV